jgi:HlyD family secretion protein
LIEIDRELYRAELGAAAVALGVAEAKLVDMRAGSRPEEIAKAKELVRQLQDSAAFAKSDLERITKLVQSGALPAESLDKARVTYVTEQARLSAAEKELEMLQAGYTQTAIGIQEAIVKEAQARLDLAKAKLAECTIFAPFSGTITRVYARKGDMASPRAALLEMADMSPIVIRVAVPEAYALKVYETMEACVSFDALPGQICGPSGPCLS